MITAASQHHILVVDDDPSVRGLLRTMLTADDMRVSEAANGAAALGEIGSNHVDLVVADIEMPVMNGVELLADIRQQARDIPVIILTGAATVDRAVDCMRRGAFDFVTKPFQTEELMSKVQRGLARRLGDTRPKVRTRPLALAGLQRPRQSKVAGFQTRRVLGQGNMGTVYLADGRVGANEGGPVALKVLRLETLAENRQSNCLRRFVHEAKAASRVSHPNVVEIYDFGVASEDGLPFIAMEYVEGCSLKEFAPDLSCDQKLQIVRQITSAVAAMHECGICHRDLKPANILITADLVVKLTDFGIARLPESELTRTSNVIGTPNYMAPESFISAKVDVRADVFSLGALSYELLVGQRPFQGDCLRDLVDCIQCARPRAPHKIEPTVPPQIEQILAQMLKKNPENRYPSAVEVLAAFDEYFAGENHQKAGGRMRQLMSSIHSSDWR